MPHDHHKRKLLQQAAPKNHVALTHGLYAVVDSEDFDRVMQHTWHVVKKRDGILKVRRSSDKMPLHCFILGLPRGTEADHKNHKTLDNRKRNLRVCTRAQNNYNRRSFKGKSRFKGVSFSNNKKKWESRIGFNNMMLWLGYFDEEEDAAIVYNVAAQLFFGEYAYLNKL